MQRICIRPLVSIITRCAAIRPVSYNVNNEKNSGFENERHDTGLICSKWEEAIIKENREPDMPFEIMEKQTITAIKHASTKQDPFRESIMK